MDWNRILALAISGAVFGALVSLGRWVYARLTPRYGRPRAIAVTLGMLLAILYGAYYSPLGEPYRARLAVQRSEQRFARLGEEAMQSILEAPEFEQKFAGLNRDQMRELGMQLAAQGLLRLPDGQLVRRMQIMDEALNRTSEASCAAALLAATPAQLFEMLSSLPDDSLREWLALASAAALATLRGEPVRTPDPQEAQRALDTVLAAMSEQDRARVAAAVANPAALDTASACWTARTLYRAAIQLPPADAAQIARVLAMQ